MHRLVFRRQTIGLDPWIDVDWTPWAAEPHELIAWVVRTPALLRLFERVHCCSEWPIFLEHESGVRTLLNEDRVKAIKDAVRATKWWEGVPEVKAVIK